MKRQFKGSTMLNPVPLTLITSKELDTDKTNVFTVCCIGTSKQTQLQYNNWRIKNG